MKEFSKQLSKLQGEQDHLWRALAESSAGVRVLATPVTFEGIQAVLPADAALVEFVLYHPHYGGRSDQRDVAAVAPRYAAYLVFRDHFDWVDLGPAAPIDEHVTAFRQALQTKQAIPTDLYDAVMRPIVAKLGSAHHLIIAPAGALSLIPFGAEIPGVPGAYELDVAFRKLVATAYTAESAAMLGAAGCGAGALGLGEEKDVSATGCLFFRPIAQCAMDYDIVKVEGDRLYNGVRGGDQCVPAGRPRALNTFSFDRVR